MRELRAPLGEHLDDAPTEERVRAVHERIRARSVLGRARTPRTRVWVAGLAAATVAALALLVLRSSPAPRGALRYGDGTALSTVETGAGTHLSFELDDGSRVSLASSTSLSPRRNTGNEVVFDLRTGSATFDVRPFTGRTWRVLGGAANVVVVGTRFVVTRDTRGVTVSVERGAVLVTPVANAAEAHLLGAGQSVRVEGRASGSSTLVSNHEVVGSRERGSNEHADSSNGSTSLDEQATSASTSTSTSPSTSLAIRPRAARSAPWRALVAHGDYRGAYDGLGATGLVQEVRVASTVEDLLALADVARLSAHPADAVTPLARIVHDHARDPRAGVAAFTLGRLELDSLHAPADAARTFARALSLGLPAALQEDAQGRLFEAYSRAGDARAATDAASQYLARYPHGHLADEARQVVQPH